MAEADSAPTTGKLEAAQADRLVALLNLLSIPDLRDEAARDADALVQSAGVSWALLIDTATKALADIALTPADWRERAAYLCANHADIISNSHLYFLFHLQQSPKATAADLRKLGRIRSWVRETERQKAKARRRDAT